VGKIFAHGAASKTRQIAMRRIQNQNLAQLLMQLRFTPPRKRQSQLDSAEKLLASIEPDREYPFEFVWYHITGFRPKELADQPAVKGSELAQDLRIFISKLSSQVAQTTAEQGQKVYTTDQLAAEFGVSTKTIHRWRRRGLMSRKFVFDDGRKRIGFARSAVVRFLQANPALAARAKSFSRLTNKDRQAIIKQAAALVEKSSLSRYRIIERLSSDTSRSHETVRYTLLNYDKAHPDKPLFARRSGVISSVQASEIYRLFKQGCGVRELMDRFARSKSSIYRLINTKRTRDILARRIEFVASDEFLAEDAAERVLAEPLAGSGRAQPALQLSGGSLTRYLQVLKDTPLLNRQREAELFRRYNYLKYLACMTRAGIRPNRVSSASLQKIEDCLAEAEDIKKTIIEANLRLVVGIAGKHGASRANLLDLVSEGNFSLVRAVEKFDYTRGFRFATYASWVIAKDFARKIPAETSRPDKAPTASLADIQRDLRIAETVDFAAVERARQSLVQVIGDNLSEREQYVILNHFGLIGSLVKKDKKTLAQIGRDLGLTRERVRQVELEALQKLRQSLSMEEFELLTGR
jgi:RNA polymerase primary sigma factor